MRAFTGLLACVLFLTACSVAPADVTATPASAFADRGEVGSVTGLDVLGPVPSSSHWHAAYVVRVCDDVLAPFESDADPLGIHSHGDGLMHIHPFFEESGYESATLGVFADAMGMTLREGELTLPGGGTWRDGDECNGVPGRVFVDRWADPDPASAVERIFTDLENVRYLADGELYQIAFAPIDSPPVVPPAVSILGEVSNLGPVPEPWVDVDPTATLDDVQVWQVSAVTPEPCESPSSAERVLSGLVRCFFPAGEKIDGSDAVMSARAVILNRRGIKTKTIESNKL